MESRVILYIDEGGKFRYGFSREDWNHIDVESLKSKGLQYVETFVYNGMRSSQLYEVYEKIEERLKIYVNELNTRKKKGEDVKLPISLDLIVDPEAITEDIWKS